jgi:predicted nuclease of predicted toxin-antitoxin system
VKLLFDENLSPRLVELLTAEFPGSAHVDQAPGRGRPGVEVWEHAIAHGYAIVSKDNDRFGDLPRESLLILEL